MQVSYLSYMLISHFSHKGRFLKLQWNLSEQGFLAAILRIHLLAQFKVSHSPKNMKQFELNVILESLIYGQKAW